MKVAVIGSRNINIDNLGSYLPSGVSEIVSGDASGVDCCAGKYALEAGIKLTEFRPEYNKYGRAAPLRCNLQIIDYADEVIAFWDGQSRGTAYVIENCKKINKKIIVIRV